MSNEKTKVKVSSTTDLQTALAAGYEASQIDFDNADAVAKAKAEGIAEGKAAAPKADTDVDKAVADERKRIADIQAIAPAGFDAEMKAAIDEGKSVADFSLAVMKAAKDRGITIEGIKKDSPPAASHAGGGNDGKQPASWDATVAKFGGK